MPIKHNKYRTLWTALAGHRLRYLAAVALMVAATLLATQAPLVVRATINSAINHEPLVASAFVQKVVDGLGGMSVIAQNLWLAALAIVGLSMIGGTMGYIRGRLISGAAETAARRLRDRLYDHLQHLPAAYHDKADAGDLIQRCTSDVETVRGLLAGQIIELGRAAVLVLAIVPYMFMMDPYLACLALVAIPLIVVFSIVFFTRIRGAFKKADEAEGAMTTQLQENLTGIRVVRAFARQDFEIGKFADRNRRFRDLQRRVIGLMSVYWSSTDFLTAVQTGLVIIAGAYWISMGRLLAGDVAAFVMYVNMFSWPVRQMGRTLADISKTTVSLTRIDDILSVPREETAPAALTAQAAASPVLWTPRGQVSVSHLSFTHNGDGHALKDLSFDVEPGLTLAILGPSGSGKSTLVHLLLRLYEYRDGSIRVDGHELRDLPLKEARTLFGVVMQEPFLFSKTVRDNIRLGALHANDEEVLQAAVMACIHDNIVEFEKGYDTVVGERGVTLSGGQRQRMALARAILKDPPILILDDALSAVDTETEVMILEALRRRHGRRTTLVIAHRLSTLMAADRILVLDGGRLAQMGTHADLIRQDGLYGRLWKIQGAVLETLDHEIQAGRSGGRSGK